MQVATGLLLSFVLVLYFQKLKPYVHRRQNTVGLTAQIALFLFLCIALMLRVEVEISTTVMSSIIIALSLLTPLVAVSLVAAVALV